MGGGLAVSREDSGARTGPHEIGLIAKIAAVSDDDAARRLYRKYRMELFRFGFHVLGDQGLAEEMVGPLLRKRPQTEGADRGARQFPEEPQLLIEGLALKRPAVPSPPFTGTSLPPPSSMAGRYPATPPWTADQGRRPGDRATGRRAYEDTNCI